MKVTFIMEDKYREFEVESVALLDGGYYLWSKDESLSEEFKKVDTGFGKGEAYEINPMELNLKGFIVTE